jgi:hypothetical protein
MMILKIVSTISCWIQTPQKYGKSSQIIIIPLYLYSIRIFIVFNKDYGKKKNKKMRPMFSWKISGWIVKSFSGPVHLVQIVRGPGGDFLHEELLGSAAAQSHGDFVQDGLGL